MTDRDHFAAAALTGLLAGRKFTALDDAIVAEAYAEAAYGIADAMLRERGNHIPDAGKMVEKPTNHDAAPAARASLPTADHAVCRGCESGCGTGDTQEPVAWAVVYPNDEVAVIAFKRRDADERATASDSVVPLYRQPQPTLTPEERMAVAWAVDAASNDMHPAKDILRELLERLGGGE